MKIGLVGTMIGEMFGASVEYMEWCRKFGEVHLISPNMGVQTDLDVVVMQGGADILPSKYSAIPMFRTSRSNPILEHFDEVMLPQYIKEKIPIFGICRGLQAINVHFGGTLQQHIWHPTSSAHDRGELVHSVTFKEDGDAEVKFEVNSLHHQAIDKLGEGLEVIAIAEDGTIEAIKHKSLPIYAVQWHPEEINELASFELMMKLLYAKK